MALPEEPPPAAVDAIRLQLRALAEPSALPVPELRIDAPRAQERLAHLDKGRALVVPRSLLSNRPRQLWELAACLGALASPVPLRRRRLGWGLFAAAGVAFIVLVAVGYRWGWVWLTLALLYPLGAWTARWERRAMEDAGRGVLAAAGHDPAEIARLAFGDEPEPTPWRHMLSNEPTPRERIAAAERSGRQRPA